MRKKIFTFLLALVTSVGLSWAWTSGDCTVTLNEGVVTVSGNGAMENYSYFTNTPWYYSRNSITSIIIEDGVTNVGDYAFARCENLESVTIGNGVVTIGESAFGECYSKFTSLTMGNSVVTIGNEAFINNSGLTTVTFPSTLQTIGEDAFYGCSKISSLTIPSSVTSIGDYAFGGCSLIAYIIAEPVTPPSTEENTFQSIISPSYIPLYVPNGSVADYTAAERWNTFNIQGYDPSMGPTIEPVPATPDLLSGAFTINAAGDQINFSKGNLQYVGSWQFAENQWNIIGNDQADDNRDLFGWGTGDAPNKVSTTLADYAEYHEWGTNMGDGWYTLSRDEWTYLFQSRTNAANLYAPANVNGVNGYVILPDEWVQPYGTTFTPGVTNYGTNVYADAAWTSMEDAGAVFLPVDGYRYNGNSIKWVGQTGWYWSSTEANVDATAWCWQLDKDNVEVQYSYNLDYGMCVRLVKAASSTPSGPTYLDADFAINFMTDPYTVVGGGDLPAGVAVEGSMNTGDAQHGYRLPVITIPVTAGNYKVMMGTCKWSNQDGFVKTEDGSYTYATLATNNGTCYDQAPATNVVGAIFNVPSDQIIKVYGAEYTPFFSIEKMAAVPAFTDFEINFQSDPYNVISGAKPAGTEIAGTYNDKLHGYQNVVATVPVEAGAYRLTLVACEFGNGAGNVMSETNVELASFNQNLGTGNCYHNNPATNIVSMTFNVDADQHIVIDCGTYTPYMKLEKISAYTVQFALGDAEGSAPAAVNVNVGEDITMPVNQTMYKAGYTLTGWTDGVSTYAIGEPFIPTSDALLTPVFTANAVAITEAAEEVTVRWYFGKSNNAPDFAWQNNNGFLIAQAIVGGNPIDVRLDVNATSGKFSNAGRDDQWAQVNSGTAFAYPYKEGMTVDVNTYSGNETYDLAAGTLTCNTNDYYSFIEVTYPAPAPTDEQVPTNADPENPSYHYSTFFHSTQNYKLTNDGTEAFIANLSAGDLVLTEIAKGTQVIPANTAVILRKNGSADPVVLTPTEENGVSVNPDDNDLQGVDEATTLESLSIDPQKCYVLSGKSHDETVTGVGFYRIYGTTLKAHKAYVIYNGSVNSNLAPRRMRFVFNTATGVESAQPSVISGQKLIENGQLIIIKNGVRYNAQGQIVK